MPGGATRPAGEVALSPEFRARWTLGRLLGAGAMGTVYLAQDLRERRPVAIKFLSRIVDGAARERFLREARMQASVQHMRVVRLLDAGEADGVPFLVTEYVSGGTLRQLLQRRKRLSPVKAVELALEILEGLQACHAEAIVHRDLKPENVLLTAREHAVIADLGIAKSYAATMRRLTGKWAVVGGGADATQHGALVGTPIYMAPEQVRGEPAIVATDLHAVGAMLYEMLAGRPPYRGVTLPGVLNAIEHEPVTELQRLAHGIPVSVAAVVMRALAKRAEARWSSAEEMATALRRAVRMPAVQDVAPVRDASPVRTALRDVVLELWSAPIWGVTAAIDRALSEIGLRSDQRLPTPILMLLFVLVGGPVGWLLLCLVLLLFPFPFFLLESRLGVLLPCALTALIPLFAGLVLRVADTAAQLREPAPPPLLNEAVVPFAGLEPGAPVLREGRVLAVKSALAARAAAPPSAPVPEAPDRPAKPLTVADRAAAVARRRAAAADARPDPVERPVDPEDRFRAATRAAPQNAGAWFGLADFLEREGRHAEALACWRTAVQADPRGGAVLARLALALDRAGQRDDAVRRMRAAVNADPGNAWYRSELGDLLERAGQHAGGAAAPRPRRHRPRVRVGGV